MALVSEVERRLEVDGQLGATRELLSRTEHEWLHFRAANARLEAEVCAWAGGWVGGVVAGAGLVAVAGAAAGGCLWRVGSGRGGAPRGL
jgi:hypothetical protein